MTAICKPDKEVMEFMRDICRSMFLDGECYAFAVALHRGLSWPIFGLMRNNEIRHAFLRPANVSDDVFFDARGYIEEEKLGKPFGLDQPYELRQIEEKDLYTKRPILDNYINKARQFAEIVWPKLDWKGGTRADKILAFAKELEALSREHGLWIRAAFPGALPLLAGGCGDESYSFKLMPDGLTYSVDRLIGQI